MKKHYFLIVGFIFFGIGNAQVLNIPDANFKSYLLYEFDTNLDFEIDQQEALSVEGIFIDSLEISDLTGIEYFLNLMYLSCRMNNIENLDVSMLTNLENLYCNNNQLQTLNISGLSNLVDLRCYENQLQSLDLSGLDSIWMLDCSSNLITNLNVTGLSSLLDFNCSHNLLNNLIFNSLPIIDHISCAFNQLETLDVSGLQNLKHLFCFNNQLNSINLSGSLNLENIICFNNQLESLNLLELPNLSFLDCSGNLIGSLDLTNNYLYEVKCNNNVLLTSLNIKNGSIENTLEFNENPNLQYICADDNQIEEIQLLITEYGYTNCSVTSNCNLLSESFNKNEIISINPNPAKETLTINAKNIEVSSISIYNNLGQLVQVIPNAKETKTIDVSQLKSGNYFIKVVSDKGTSSSKFIKE